MFSAQPVKTDCSPVVAQPRVSRTAVARGAACVVFAAAVALIGWAPVAGPDMILVGGKVYTVNEAQPWAEAVAITGDRISAVGSDSEIRALANP